MVTRLRLLAYAGFSALVGVTVSSLANEGSMLGEHLWSTVLASLTGLVAALIFANLAEQWFTHEVAAEPVVAQPVFHPPPPARAPQLRHAVAPRVELDLAEVAEDVLDTFAHSAETRSIELASVIDPELPAQVFGDPMQLEQVLLSAVGRALESDVRSVALRIMRSKSDPSRVRIAVNGEELDLPLALGAEKQREPGEEKVVFVVGASPILAESMRAIFRTGGAHRPVFMGPSQIAERVKEADRGENIPLIAVVHYPDFDVGSLELDPRLSPVVLLAPPSLVPALQSREQPRKTKVHGLPVRRKMLADLSGGEPQPPIPSRRKMRHTSSTQSIDLQADLPGLERAVAQKGEMAR